MRFDDTPDTDPQQAPAEPGAGGGKDGHRPLENTPTGVTLAAAPPPTTEAGDGTTDVDFAGWEEVDAEEALTRALAKLSYYEAPRLLGLLGAPDKYSRTYPSTSEMDFAVVTMLLKGGLSGDEVVAVWRQSPLGKRPKTNRRNDYVSRTLRLARAHLGLNGTGGNGGDSGSSESEPTMLGGSEETTLEIIPSTEIPPPDPGAEKALLEPIVPEPPGLVLLSGETSAGKTALSRNVSVSLAEGEEFAGLSPARPVRVLYVDLESPENVHRGLVEAIGRSPNLGFVRRLPRTLGSEEGRQSLRKAIEEWGADVVFIDPLAIAWPCKDENDNAEADRQMTGLKMLAVETSTIIIALWNMGEGQVKEKFRARGATARLDRVDLGLNYKELLPDTRQLKIVKSRYGTLGRSLTLKFAGDMGFEPVETGDDPAASRLAQKQVAVSEFLMERSRGGQEVVSRREIVEALGDEDLLDKAMRRMVLGGQVGKVGRGRYRLPVSSEPPSVDGSEDRKGSAGNARLEIMEGEDDGIAGVG